jgi:ATP-binding cassette subfamily B protein
MIKCLARSIRQYKKDSILTPVFVMLEVVIEVIIPFLMANLIDLGIDTGDMPYILKTGITLLILAFLALYFGTMAGRYAASASAGFARNLRHDMYYNVQNFSFSNIDKFSTASIVTRLTTDVTNLQMAYQMIIRLAVRSPFMILFSLVAAFRISAGLSLIFLAVIPVLGIGLWLIIKNAYPIFERVLRSYDRLNNIVAENLSGIRVVKSFNREEYEIKKFNDTSDQIYRDFSRAEKLMAYNMPLMQFCVYACMLLISWFGARMIVLSGGNPDTGLSTGQLMTLITYVTQILISLMQISVVLVMITISRVSAERIVELLEEKSDIQNSENPVMAVKNGEVRFESVNFSYTKNAGKMCLHNINLAIKSGETVGILGVTGSSKTSLVQMIPRLYDVVSGRVMVGGVDVRDYDLEMLRNEVAMVLQKNLLFSGTIKENLRWGNENAPDAELVQACKLAQADDFVRGFPDGYDTHIEQGGTNLSGGQKQRLCIARALLKNPKILILDDSTSAVDTQTDALIRRALNDNLPETTKIIIAQRVSSVMNADKIVIMDEGEINAVGTHEELLKSNPAYRDVYESQAMVVTINE